MPDLGDCTMNIEPDKASAGVASESSPALRRGLPANGTSDFFPTMLLQKNGISGYINHGHDGDGALVSSSSGKTVEQFKKSFGGKEGKPFVRDRDGINPVVDHESENPTLSSPDPAEDSQDMAIDDEVKDSDEQEEEDSEESESEIEVEEKDEEEGREATGGDSDGDVKNDEMEVVASDIGETEDELKVNAAGRQPSSDEDSDDDFIGGDDDGDDDDDDDDDVEERPWSRSRDNKNLLTFVSGPGASTLGTHVKRPTPVGGGSRDNSPLNVDRNNEQDASDDDSSSSSSSSTSGGRGLDVDLEDSGDSDPEKDSDIAEDEESVSSEGSEGLVNDEEESDDDDEEDEEAEDDDDSAKNKEQDEDEDAVIDDNKLSSSIEVELERALDDKEESRNGGSGGASAARSSGKGKRLELLQRGSISMEELEDIINESPRGDESEQESDMDFSDAEPSHAKLSPVNDFSDEEVAGLLSDSFEFDYWSSDSVSAIVKVLSTVKDTDHDLKCSQYPIRLPPSEDASFWIDKMLVAVSPQSPALPILAESPEMRRYASKKIHNMFYTELSALDISHVNLNPEASTSKHPEPSWRPRKGRHLFVGSFAGAESRLALAALHVKHVIQISGHPLDELWVGDGVKYSTHILPGCVDGGADTVCDIIAQAAGEVASDLADETVTGEGNSVLVACSTGDEHSCAVSALFLMQAFGIEKEAAIEWMVKARQTSTIEPSWIKSSPIKSPLLCNVAQKISPSSTSKRVLSSQMLSALLRDPSSSESPKRQKVRFGPPEHTKKETEGMTIATLPDLPLFSLGEAAQSALMIRNPEKEVASSTDDEDEIERRLGEELADRTIDKDESEPVPLLTPPASPLVIHAEEGDATVCEWPSNLAVDSAMTSAITLTRPLSPNSLQKQEEEEFKRLAESPKREVQGPPNPATGLTPKLQGISVSFR